MLSKVSRSGSKLAAFSARAIARRTPTFVAPAVYFSTTKHWVPMDQDKLMQITMRSLIAEVAEQQKDLAAKVVPWFLTNMPAAYFRQVPENLRSQHVKAITALRDLMQSELSLKMETKFENGVQITFINSQTKTGSLHDQLNSMTIPADHHLSNVNVFSSIDGELALNIFSFERNEIKNQGATRKNATRLMEYLQRVKNGEFKGDPNVPAFNEQLFGDSALDEFLARCPANYVENTDPRRFMVQRAMYEKVRNNDGTAVLIEPYTGSSAPSTASWITLTASNVLPEVLLKIVAGILSGRSLDITRSYMYEIDSPETSIPEIPGHVTVLRILVNPVGGAKCLNIDTEYAATLAKDLKRAKWLDNEVTDMGIRRHPSLGLDRAEVITALSSMLHGPLFKIDPNTFSSIKSIIQLIDSSNNHVSIASAIADLFLDKFNPEVRIEESEITKRNHDITDRIKNLQLGPRTLLSKMLDATNKTLRTNFFIDGRYALSLRVDPMIMMPESGPTSERPLPFGVFFVHGRHFNAFHNRFRDIARGGLRIVTPVNSDQYALESSRQYDEVYGLSYAQQLKNKDIPEGGSKGVVLINTPGIKGYTKFFAMRKSVRAFSDALLDLIVKDTVSQLVDYYGKDELIYLGPDEQIIPSDIEWIIKRAGQRGYPLPAAFMSSKKDDGFNHKEFGVTSEGVNVYLDVALRHALNIDPRKQPFTIKITGGPDGDVAGNLMRILNRDYGSNCKILGIADGFGVAEDPEGLDHEELIRLFNEGLPIDHFNPGKLSSGGICMSATTEEGAARRNTMVFRIKSDVFVPGGGRPNTINAQNWEQFLLPDGKPSSPLIVEGANLFLNKEARELLFTKAGVSIIKDSSANKCGVITSSCEVMSSMLLAKEEFMAIKPELVEDVLVKLRNVARLEGELLFREFKNYPGALPHFSERISNAIAKVTDAVTDKLAHVQPEDPLFKELLPLIGETLPKKLNEVAGDRVPTRFPVQYQRNAIASTLASKIVYKEGIHLIETQPIERIADRAIEYFRAEKKMNKVIEDVEAGNIDAHKAQVVDILKRGGTRTSLNIF